MKQLELKVHPPIVFLIFVGIMWLIAQVLPGFELSLVLRKVGLFIGVSIALSIALSAIIGFRLAKTTVDPQRPDLSTSLVTSGIFKYTRNPMYLGLITLLCTFSIYLSNAYVLISVIGFVAYIVQFQIKPEEEKLAELFGKKFMNYQQQVRRWL